MQSRKGSSLDKEERTQRQERRKKIEEKIKCDKRGFEFCFMENRSSLKSYLDKRQHPRKKMTMCYQEMDEIRQPGEAFGTQACQDKAQPPEQCMLQWWMPPGQQCGPRTRFVFVPAPQND